MGALASSAPSISDAWLSLSAKIVALASPRAVSRATFAKKPVQKYSAAALRMQGASQAARSSSSAAWARAWPLIRCEAALPAPKLRTPSTIDKHQLRLMPGHLVAADPSKGRDGDQVAGSGAACGRAVDRNHAGAALALDGVSGETLAVVDVPDMDMLIHGDVGRVQQVFVDGA